MKKAGFTLILLLFALSIYAQTWSGTTPGNIYYNQGNVTLGGSTSSGATLHIGKQEAAPHTVGEVSRLSIQPFGHTGGPWIFKARDIPGVAFLDIFYGTSASMTLSSSGNVGIGTTSPGSKLHVADGNGGEQIRLSRGTGIVRFAQDINQDNLYLYNGDASKMYMAWTANGYVGIGTTRPDHKLTVDGGIHAREVIVDLNIPGPDYVFEKDYDLLSLEEIRTYIEQNKHLPEVPSAKEMEANGVNLGEMNMLLLKKVEELTLYLLQKDKEIQDLRIDLEKIKNKQ